MMPAVPPNIRPEDLPAFVCRGCAGIDPVELEVLEDTPCRHCGAAVTIDDRLEHAREVMNALVRLGYGEALVKAVTEAGDRTEAVPEDLAIAEELQKANKG